MVYPSDLYSNNSYNAWDEGDPYAMGYTDGQAGSENNPYPEESADWEEYELGWSAGMAEFFQDDEEDWEDQDQVFEEEDSS